ncbi:hypothetical protein ACIA5H_07980 [Nocardia sp. NPDC051900]|uniref:hypothetical protein n=1 Tax=Nocardia sp. NPDC051900 TaxID=3364326 RepID=UPI00379A9FC9
MAEVFDGIWNRARDLDELPVSPVEQRVLRALTRYDTDDSAARALNVSVRKFRGHVADLMDRLGARTRFQAALLAKGQKLHIALQEPADPWDPAAEPTDAAEHEQRSRAVGRSSRPTALWNDEAKRRN